MKWCCGVLQVLYAVLRLCSLSCVICCTDDVILFSCPYPWCHCGAAEVEQRLRERKIQLRVTDSAVELIGQMGYDHYGARPVKRVIQHNVENELAKGIPRGEYGEDDVVTIDTETLPPPPATHRACGIQEARVPGRPAQLARPTCARSRNSARLFEHLTESHHKVYDVW